MKTMLTIEFFSLIIAIGAYLFDRDHQTTTSNDGWTRKYTIPRCVRKISMRLGYVAFLMSITGILLAIWTHLP